MIIRTGELLITAPLAIPPPIDFRRFLVKVNRTQKFQNLEISRNNRPPPNNRTPRNSEDFWLIWRRRRKKMDTKRTVFRGVNVFLRRRRKFLDTESVVSREIFGKSKPHPKNFGEFLWKVNRTPKISKSLNLGEITAPFLRGGGY